MFQSRRLFLTNYHVIQGLDLLDDVPLVLNSGDRKKEKVVKAKLLNVESTMDLALLKIESEEPLPFVELAPPDHKLDLQDEISAFGYPGGVVAVDGSHPAITITTGQITSLGKDANNDLSHIRVDAPINPGNSGGPLINSNGQVIGVVTSKFLPPAELTSFAVPLNYVRIFLNIPGLKMVIPEVEWKDRYQPIEVEVKIIAGYQSQPVDRVQLTVSTSEKDIRKKSKSIPKGADSVVFTIHPHPKQKLNLLLKTGAHDNPQNLRTQTVADRVLNQQSGLKLSEVTMIQRLDKDRVSVYLHNGTV